MSDWATGWEGLATGLRAGAQLREQRRARETQTDLDRQRIDLERQRTESATRAADADLELGKLNQALLRKRLTAFDAPMPAGARFKGGISGPNGNQSEFESSVPAPINTQPVPDMPYKAISQGGGPATYVPTGFGGGPSPTPGAEGDRLPDVNTTPTTEPAELPDSGLINGTPRPIGMRQGMKTGPSGLPELTFDPVYPGLTPTQVRQLQNNPELAAQANSAYSPMADKVVTAHKENIKEIKSTLENNPSAKIYLGAGGAAGARQTGMQMENLVQGARDATGKIDFSKINPVQAFSMLYKDGKIDDPNAVIRQSELDNIASQVGIVDRGQNFLNKILKGQHYPPALLANIYDKVKKNVGSAQAEFFRNLHGVERVAQSHNVPIHHYLPDEDLANTYQQWKGAPRVTSQQQLDSLPSGAAFVDSTGQLKYKR